MKPVSNESLMAQLNWRYATKSFDPAKKISPADWATLEQSLILTPSSFGLQPWKFFVITDPAVKTRLPAMSWDQPQVRDCSHLVVFTVRKVLDEAFVDQFLARTAEVRSLPVAALNGYKQMIMGSVNGSVGHHETWNARQAYIALGQLMTSAAMLGIDACPMEGIIKPEYEKLLETDKQGLAVVCACAVGYRSANDKYAHAPKVRFPASMVVQHV